jgi:ABC-2 type transport system ATP-binding protein
MEVIRAEGLTHRYGKVEALSGVDIEVPEGAIYALLGPNGAGKTTLLQILMGMLRPSAGRVELLGREPGRLALQDRASIGYVAEGQRLPGWMTVRQLEAYVAPLYPTWDAALADELRDRFRLQPDRKIKALSRGEYMKAALLIALAPRPRLLLMDEPFTGMDAMVKDELVRGLLDSAGREGWTVLICSHDIAELEMLADWVGVLDAGRLKLSAPMDEVRERFKRVEVVLGGAADPLPRELPASWLSFERAGSRVGFVVTDAGPAEYELATYFPGAARIEVRAAKLREVFLGVTRGSAASGVSTGGAAR